MTEQLELGLGGPHRGVDRCACGAFLRSSVEDYRGLCDRCILQKTIAGHVWSEDPLSTRAHLARWLARQGYGQVVPCVDESECFGHAKGYNSWTYRLCPHCWNLRPPGR